MNFTKDSATRIVTERAINLGFDVDTTDAHIADIGDEGFQVIADIFNEADQITNYRSEGMMSHFDLFVPNVVTILLYELGSSSFTENALHISKIITGMAEAMRVVQLNHFHNADKIVQVINGVMSVHEFMHVLPELPPAKVMAVMATLMEFEEYRILKGGSGQTTSEALELILPAIDVVTEEDLEHMLTSAPALSYRQRYLKQVFPYPNFGNNSRYYLTESVVDRIIELHASARPTDDVETARDFSMFLNEKVSVSNIEEAFSYLPLIKVTDGKSWKCVFDSLRHTNGIPYHEDYSKVTGAERRQCEALITVLVEVFQKDNPRIPGMDNLLAENSDKTVVWVPSDQRLIDFLMAHPERAVEVAAVVRDRNTLDWEMVSITLDNASALSVGSL